MSHLPLVNVTARINDQSGLPVCGAVVKMTLHGVDKYCGLVVPRETAVVTDAAGVGVLKVFPNVGYEGTYYDVHISFPSKSAFQPPHHRPPMPPMPPHHHDHHHGHEPFNPMAPHGCPNPPDPFCTKPPMPPRPEPHCDHGHFPPLHDHHHGFDPHRPPMPPHVHGCELPVMKPIRCTAVVPNSDCNLLDIINLPPNDQRPLASVLPEEVAGYAAQAGSAADQARDYAASANSALNTVRLGLDEIEAAKKAVHASETSAASSAATAKNLLGQMNDIACHFEHTVTNRVEETAQRLQQDATRQINNQKAMAIDAIDQSRDKALDTIELLAQQTKTDAIIAVNSARDSAIHLIGDAKLNAVDEIREMAGQYDEDFTNLVERAESAAKRSSCASSSAAASATKACLCAERSEAAVITVEQIARNQDHVLKEVEAHAESTKSDMQRAEAAADSAKKYAGQADGSNKAAQKAADAAGASAKDAKLSAEQAVAAQQAVAADKEFVERIKDDAEAALKDIAVQEILPLVKDEAVEQATSEAREAAETAHQFADSSAFWAEESKKAAKSIEGDASEAKAAAVAAKNDAAKAEVAAKAAENKAAEAVQAASDAACSADKAEEFANAVEQKLAEAQLSHAALQEQIARLSARMTKVELDHATSAHPCPGEGEGGGSGGGLTPDDIKGVVELVLQQKGIEPANFTSPAQVQNIVNTAISALPPAGLPADQVQTMVNDAINALPPAGLPEEQVREIVDTAIDGIRAELPKSGLTEDEVKAIADKAAADAIAADPSVKPEQLQALVDAAIAEYLANHPLEGITEEQARQIVNDAIAADNSTDVTIAKDSIVANGITIGVVESVEG